MITGHSWLNDNLEVKESDLEGKGVFALKHIKCGERLAIFGGSIMLIDELNDMHEDHNAQEHAMQIEERVLIGNKSSTPEGTDYFNHSCNPNSGFQGQIFLVAMQDIEKGKEITVVFKITKDDLTFVDKNNSSIYEEGDFEIYISNLTNKFILKK